MVDPQKNWVFYKIPVLNIKGKKTFKKKTKKNQAIPILKVNNSNKKFFKIVSLAFQYF